MRSTSAILLSAAVLLGAACTATTADPVPGPTVTVTEIETVTEAPTETPTAAPVQDGCQTLAGGESFAFVFVTSPAVGAQVQPDFTFTGCSNSFEAAFLWALYDHDGNVLSDGFGTATCGTGCVGTFQVTVPYTVNQPTIGSLEVWTASAQDGSKQDVNAIPVVLNP